MLLGAATQVVRTGNWDARYGVSFRVYIAGDDGHVMSAVSQGAAWVWTDLHFSVSTDAHLLSVAFADETHGWTVGTNGTIFATEDAGLTWAPQGQDLGFRGRRPHLRHLHMRDRLKGWIVGDDSTLLYTSNGGGEPESFARRECCV